MTIHKEGNKTIALAAIVFVATVILFYFIFKNNSTIFYILTSVLFLFFIFIVSFFRKPTRIIEDINDGLIYAPADGKVVVIEKTKIDEFLDEERIQVSIFMSPLNVHINWYPISGIVRYFKHHCGNYLVAWHPKSSCENERTTIVLENEKP